MKYLEKEQDFQELLNNELVLVDFYATWCGPCQMLSPLLEELSKENKKLTIIKVDVEKFPNLAKKHGVLSIPAIEIYKKSKLTNKAIGYLSKEELEDLFK